MTFKLVNINIAIFMKKKVTLLYLTILCIMVTMFFFELVLW